MKIQLDHIQRLNLRALLGAQGRDLATVRAPPQVVSTQGRLWQCSPNSLRTPLCSLRLLL
jgi:hypothetical protein